MSVTKRDNEWCNEWRVVQRVTNDNGRQQVFISANFPIFCELREEPTTKHPKENSLKLEADLEEGPLN